MFPEGVRRDVGIFGAAGVQEFVMSFSVSALATWNSGPRDWEIFRNAVSWIVTTAREYLGSWEESFSEGIGMTKCGGL